MGYSVYGKCYDENGNTLSGVKIKPYFKKVDSESDPSMWSTEWYESDGNGYYSYSPEDSNLLTSEGSYKKTKDKFYVVYVYDEANKDSLTISRASFHAHTIPSADDKEINLVVETKRSPIVTAHSFPTAVLTQHEYTMSESSYVDTDWVTLGQAENVSQKLTYDLVDIFDGHQVIDTLYRWDEIAERSVANSSSDSYTFVGSGVYNLGITAREKWNTEVVMSQQVTVKYNEPEMDFNWTPTQTNDWQGAKIKGQETITFHNTSTSLDDRMNEPYRYKWVVTDELQDGSDNTQIWDDQVYTFKPSHDFQSIGTKTVTLTAYWNDGFVDKEVSITKALEVCAFDIVPEFNWDILNPTRRNQDITFNPDLTSGDTDKIVQYDWVIEDSYPASTIDLDTFDSGTSVFGEHSTDGSIEIDNTYTKINEQYPVVKFHSRGDKLITLTMTYYNGWVNVTEQINHTVIPTKYEVNPAYTISDTTPMGRDKTVVFNNTTDYVRDTFDIGYWVDWAVEDKYSICNLENPEPGIETDHTKLLIGVDKDYVVNQNYQNTETNQVELTIRYDDGWQMQTKRLVKTVTPEVYPAPVPQFTWDVAVPTDRTQIVTFTDITSDPYTRFRAYEWTIPDSYNKWNPDNVQYGIEVVDNTQVINYNTDSTLAPQQAFQDNVTRSIEMVYHYDDGFCERTVSKVNEITFTEYAIVPVITTDVVPTANGFIGKVEINYNNSSTGDVSRMLDEKWTWNDKTFPDGLDEITTRDDQVIDALQPFTWQYPSRKPYSAIGGSIEQNINKSVTMEVRIDTGWRNNTDDGMVGPDNNGAGGLVYYEVTSMYEATPKEISSEITYTCNDENYSH